LQTHALTFLLLASVSCVQGEDLFSSAFAEGKVQGNATLFAYNIDKKEQENAYATALGGFLKYTTDDSKPLSASVRFHQSSPIGPNKNPEATALFNNDKGASSLTAVSEAFLSYRNKDRFLKIGNMMLSTPMMNDDTTRIVPWSYQGLVLTSESLTDTRIQLNYITQIRENTSADYTKQSASGEFEDGITMLAITYEGLKDLSLQSYYYHAPELYSTFIGQIDYQQVSGDDYLFCAGLQYFKSGNGGIYNERTSNNGGDDIDLLALKFGVDGESWNATLNYSQNFGVSGIVKGYGGLAKVYTTSMVANGRGNFKPETWMLHSRFDVDPLSYGQSEFALWLTHTRVHDERGDDFNAYYTHLRHYFDADTSVYLRFEAIDYLNGKDDVNYLRLITSYDF
jgi:outer membrane porin, OprD family